MKTVKRSIYNLSFAAAMLGGGLLSQLAVTALLREVGIEIPDWLAIAIAGVGTVAAVVGLLLAAGVTGGATIPPAVKIALAGATTASA